MLPTNIVSIEKKQSSSNYRNIKGSVFHLFYPNIHTAYLFDSDFTTPIIWGSKTIVIGVLKTIDKLMNVKTNHKIKLYQYIIDENGYRRIHTYHGPIETIGKNIKYI